MLLQRTAKSDIWSERNPRRLTRLKLAGRRHHHYTTTAHVGGRVGGARLGLMLTFSLSVRRTSGIFACTLSTGWRWRHPSNFSHDVIVHRAIGEFCSVVDHTHLRSYLWAFLCIR